MPVPAEITMESLRLEAVRHTGLWKGLRGDIVVNLGIRRGRRGPLAILLRAIVHPELRLCLLMRLAARSPRRTRWLWRNLTMALHGSEVQPGAIFEPGLRIPHPFGLAIGATTQTGHKVVLAHRTSFATRTEAGRISPRRVVLGNGAKVLNNSVVMGGVQIGPGAVVGPHAVVTHSVRAGTETESHSRH